MIYGLKEADPLSRMRYYAVEVSLLSAKSKYEELKLAMEELNRAYEAAYGHRSD